MYNNIFETPEVDMVNYMTDNQSEYYWIELDEQEMVDRGMVIPVYSTY